jgi:hypothetical protein
MILVTAPFTSPRLCEEGKNRQVVYRSGDHHRQRERKKSGKKAET